MLFMKKFLLLFIFMLAAGVAFAQSDLTLRDYDGIEVPRGTYIPVMNTEELSTAYCEEGKNVKFISTNDIYLYETNIIPKNSTFYGRIEKIYEPVTGTNGGMVIVIKKLMLPDGFEIPVRGVIYTSNNNIIGAEITPPTKYIKMPHYQQGFYWGTIQWVAGPMRKMGEHTVVASGADLTIMLTAPAYITHTLTN